MTVPLSIPTVLGSLAIVSTSALVALQAIVAHSLVNPAPPSTNKIALASSVFEGTVLAVLSTHLFLYTRRIRGSASTNKPDAHLFQRPSRHGPWFGLTVFACTAAAAISVAALVSLGKSVKSPSCMLFGSRAVPYLAGASVTLGVCYAAQLLFLIAALMVARSLGVDSSLPPQPEFLESGSGASTRPSNNSHAARSGVREKSRSPRSAIQVKSIPYTQTSVPVIKEAKKMPSSIRSRSDNDSAYAEASIPSPPGSSSGRSATDTVHSIRSSLSHVTRSIASKTRFISSSSGDTSSRSSQRSLVWRRASLSASSISPASSSALREREVRPSLEDFDSWDTSAVDPQTRQTVLETSASPATTTASRFLETIPASPATSRCPSPGVPLQLEPPRSRRRSRSYSPVSSSPSMNNMRMRAQSQTQSPPPGEAHIHPLFRSDSPIPPPAVSAGTVVIAAPNGGQTLASDAQSIRTLNRMRSGSLPTSPSPLSQQGSFEDIGLRRGMALAERKYTREGGDTHKEDEAADEADPEALADSGERRMTPPIPDWILSAGTRASLSGYQSRKKRAREGAH